MAFCASLRRRNAHGHFTRAILRENAGRSFCASLRKPNAHGHFYKSHFVWRIYRENAGCSFCASLRRPNAHGHFYKSHFVWKFTGKMPHAPAITSIKHRALTLTVRTLSVATLFGEYNAIPKSIRRISHSNDSTVSSCGLASSPAGAGGAGGGAGGEQLPGRAAR